MELPDNYYAFDAQKLIATGMISDIVNRLNTYENQNDIGNILFFELTTGRQVDFDLSGSPGELEQRFGKPSVAAEEESGSSAEVQGGSVELGMPRKIQGRPELGAPKKARGRPKLGVVGREITLLPRHWQWLDRQRGGSSAVLRRLIDEARKSRADEDKIRDSQDSANRFMGAMAGNLPGFEEAVRALYAGDRSRFEQEIGQWPVDIRECSKRYADHAVG